MKKLILLSLIRNYKAKPSFRRKLKIFAAVGLVAFLITGGLLIWAGISASMYVAGKAQEVIEHPQTTAQVGVHVEKLRKEVASFSTFKPFDCWNKAQTLIAIEPWVQLPAIDNLKNLKAACVGSTVSG